MTKWHNIGLSVISAALIVAQAGCIEHDAPLAPTPGEEPGGREELLASLNCRMVVRSGEMSCTLAEPAPSAGVTPVVLGGQGTYISLEASNVAYEGEVFRADVTVRNLINQPLGTEDGLSVHPDGIRVFFTGEPVALPADAGQVTLENEDGTAMFIGSDQPYFQYQQLLTPGQTSLPRTWRWHVPAGVESFTFGAYVAAPVVSGKEITPGLHFVPTTISVGQHHSCLVSSAGKLYCWGLGTNGILGDGSTSDRNKPYPVADPDDGPVEYVSVSIGYHHTCALSSEGKAYCWGVNESGQLGNGSTFPTSTPDAVSDPQGESPRYVSIAAGLFHTCAVAETGKAYCWGSAAHGALGDGGTTDRTVPVPVVDTMDGGVQFTSVVAGQDFTCALTTGRRAYCWGHAGRLGTGDSVSRTIPAPVAPPKGESEPLEFVSISASVSSHTCGLTVDGTIYCWGENHLGALGDGTFQNNSLVPTRVLDPSDGPVRYTYVGVGGQHSCAISETGKAYCWGRNTDGRLGVGYAGLFELTPVEVADAESGPLTFASIVGGSAQTCAWSTNGKAYCWGADTNGNLGAGGIGDQPYPVPVANPEDGPPIFAASFLPGEGWICGDVRGASGSCGASGAPAGLDGGRREDTLMAQDLLRRLPLLAYLGERAGHTQSPRG